MRRTSFDDAAGEPHELGKSAIRDAGRSQVAEVPGRPQLDVDELVDQRAPLVE